MECSMPKCKGKTRELPNREDGSRKYYECKKCGDLQIIYK